MSEAAEFGEIAIAKFTSDRFASWIRRVIDGETSDEVSPLRSRKSIGKKVRLNLTRTIARLY